MRANRFSFSGNTYKVLIKKVKIIFSGKKSRIEGSWVIGFVGLMETRKRGRLMISYLG